MATLSQRLTIPRIREYLQAVSHKRTVTKCVGYLTGILSRHVVCGNYFAPVLFPRPHFSETILLRIWKPLFFESFKKYRNPTAIA